MTPAALSSVGIGPDETPKTSFVVTSTWMVVRRQGLVPIPAYEGAFLRLSRIGQDRTGQDGPGRDRTGQDGPGRARTGQDGPGRARTGQDGPGRDRTGQDGTGRDRTGQDGTGRDGTGQDRTGQDRGIGAARPPSMSLLTVCEPPTRWRNDTARISSSHELVKGGCAATRPLIGSARDGEQWRRRRQRSAARLLVIGPPYEFETACSGAR
jgi:hypothetical protein